MLRTAARRGFTIVELMVALAVAAILLTLVYQVFISQRRTYTTQEDVVEMQQSARVGLETLTRDLQNIGAGVPQGEKQLLYCSPYEIVFYGNLDLDLDGSTGPADPSTSITLLYSGGSTTTPATAQTSTNAETYQIALQDDGSGVTYNLVRQKLWGSNSAADEIVVNLSTNDGVGTVPLFRYWGDFDDAHPDPDLWGDANGDDTLDAAEIAALTPVTPGAGQVLEDIVQRVEVQLVVEARHTDQVTGLQRRRVLRSNVVPRNLWPCPSFDTAPTVGPLTVDDLFSATPTTQVEFRVKYQNQPYNDEQVFFTLANTNSPLVDSTSSASSPEWTVAPDGIATTTITWSPDCAAVQTHFNSGGGNLTYELTATLAPFVSPFGTCPSTSQTVPIVVGPGNADRIEVTISPDRISTCGAEDSYEFTAEGWNDMGTCGSSFAVSVPPDPPVDFDALTNGGGTGTITDNGVLDLAAETFTVTRPSGYSFGTLAGDNFPLYLTASPSSPPTINYAGGYGNTPPATGNNTVAIIPWPPYQLDWTPTATVGNNGTLGPFEDCVEAAYSDSFRVQDCGGTGLILPLQPKPGGFSEGNYEVLGTLANDPNTAAPAEQGGIWSDPDDTTPGPTVNITTPLVSGAGVAAEYDVSYTTPLCTLDPTAVPAGVNPHIELALSGDAATVNPGPPWTDMQLNSCRDSCAITAMVQPSGVYSNPLTLTECEVPATMLIQVTRCDLDQKEVQLNLTQSGASSTVHFESLAGAASGNQITVQFSGNNPSVAEAYLVIEEAADGANIAITADYLDASGSPYWTCDTLDVSVENLCSALDIYTDPGYSQALTKGASDCISGINNLYFEVDDCQFTANSVNASAGKGLWVSTLVNGAEWDREPVDMVPYKIDPFGTGASNSASLRSGSPLLFFEDSFAAVHSDGWLTYPPWGRVEVRAQYTDPKDPADSGCDETVALTSPLPICFPNAITSGGGAGWNGNFKAHWGDVVVRGNIALPAVSKRIEKLSTGQFNGSPFGGSGNTDRFVDIYVGKTFPGDTATGNYTGLANPDPSTIDQPFMGTNHGNYFRNVSYGKITDMISVIDYDTMKTLAEDRGVYWYTLPGGDLRNPETGQVADLQTVLTLPGPGLENAYHDGDYIFVDTYGTATTPPNSTGFDVDSTPTASLPTHSLSGDLFSEGIIYIAGNVDFVGLGSTTNISATSPPEYELHYDHNTVGWLTNESQLPIRSDPTLPQQNFSLGVHINGAFYTDGQVGGSGNPAIFGAVTAERGYQGSGTPEIWYNYNLNVSGENESLCVECCTLQVSPGFTSVVVGDTVALTGMDASGAVEWTIAGNWPDVAGMTVATVDMLTGVLTAQNTGWVQVRARDINNCVAYGTVWVAAPCDVFTSWSNADPNWAQMNIGDGQRFTLDYTPSGAGSVTWNIAPWSDQSAQIIGSGVAAGKDYVDVLATCGGTWTVIEAHDPSCSWPLELWVDVDCPRPCSLNFAATPTTLPTGGSFTIAAKTDLCEVEWQLYEGGTLIGWAWPGSTVTGTYASMKVDSATPLLAELSGLMDTPPGIQVSVQANTWCDAGCTDSASFGVAACSAITVTQNTAGSPLQAGKTYSFTAAGGKEDYTWRLGAASVGSGTYSVSPAPDTEFTDFTPTAGGAVIVEVEDANGCTGATNVQVCGLALDTAATTVEVSGTTATVNASGAVGTVNWTWTTPDGADLGLSSVTGSSTTITGLVTGTATLTATDDGLAGCSADAAIRVIAAPGAWLQLTYDDFESGWGNYTDGGNRVDLYTGGTLAPEGNNAAGISDDLGANSTFTLTTPVDVDTPGYTEIMVQFEYRGEGMDTGENFWLEYYDGSSWQIIGTWTADTDFVNGVVNSATVTISEASYTFPSDMKIRFQCNSSALSDLVYIDVVRISAR